LWELASYSIPELEKLVAKAFDLKAKDAKPRLAQILGDTMELKPGNLILKRTKQ
jgi:hypothetical protein